MLHKFNLSKTIPPPAVSSTSCQVYPSEYVYTFASVNRAENTSANCRRYPKALLQARVYLPDFTHCDGTHLTLVDSDLGPEQYLATNYYVWSAGSDEQLLFIFPTAVSLTTITLHYYSDSDRGLPELRFYAVLEYFDVWDRLREFISYMYPRVDVASVPPGGRRANRLQEHQHHDQCQLQHKESADVQVW